MAINIFQEIHDRVSAEEAARYYGLIFDAKGRAICPFHDDTHPSMSFKHGRFRCWSCGASGDAIDFVSHFFNLSLLDAAKKLNIDFLLNIRLNSPENAIDPNALEVARKHNLFECWRQSFISDLNEACRIGHIAMLHCSNLDDLSESETIAVRMHECFWYWSDLLSNGSPSDQVHIYHERKVIAKWIGKVLKNV